ADLGGSGKHGNGDAGDGGGDGDEHESWSFRTSAGVGWSVPRPVHGGQQGRSMNISKKSLTFSPQPDCPVLGQFGSAQRLSGVGGSATSWRACSTARLALLASSSRASPKVWSSMRVRGSPAPSAAPSAMPSAPSTSGSSSSR